MTLHSVLLWTSLPFVCATFAFARFKGEISYYESSDYEGNGTAH